MKRPSLKRRHPAALPCLGLAMTLALAACGGGGGGETVSPPPVTPTAPAALLPAELAVLIAEGDATSEAIGRAYQQARGIPEANMVRVPVSSRGDVIDADSFASLKAAIDARLPATVQATLVTWMQPSRVTGACTMGLTSALAFGYDARYCVSVPGCATTAASPYYDSNTRTPWTTLRVRPSMMLGASTLADAQVLINRGLAADGKQTAGNTGAQGWLMYTSDTSRNVRGDDFRGLAGINTPGVTMNFVDNSAGRASDIISNQARVLFYFTGLVTVPQISSNQYLPGAVADHLTSYGGYLPDGNGQMPITAWLQAGATGSYGTVEEPCNFQQKFPRASVMVNRYQRGDTLIEAYWKSVQWPGQGLFVGEPLARPWAP